MYRFGHEAIDWSPVPVLNLLKCQVPDDVVRVWTATPAPIKKVFRCARHSVQRQYPIILAVTNQFMSLSIILILSFCNFKLACVDGLLNIFLEYESLDRQTFSFRYGSDGIPVYLSGIFSTHLRLWFLSVLGKLLLLDSYLPAKFWCELEQAYLCHVSQEVCFRLADVV